MSVKRYHINNDGVPGVCAAQKSCPFGNFDTDHFATAEDARSFYEQKMKNNAFDNSPKREQRQPKLIQLSSNVGSAEVIDGDLTSSRARVLLSSGLCGDLALAVYNKTGGDPYFLSYSVSSSEKLLELFTDDPDNIFRITNHVMIESSVESENFIDAYGRSDYEDIEDNWDAAFAVKGTPEMLKHFANIENSKRLSNFADSVINLDLKGELYPIDLDELDYE